MSDLPPISDAPIFKTMVSDGSSLFPVDTIEHEGRLWLVLRWLYPPSREWRAPERLICISNLGFQDLRNMPNAPADFSVPVPLPKVLFETIPTLPAEQYIVIEHPRLRFRMPSIH
jgi:hypothetical protein